MTRGRCLAVVLAAATLALVPEPTRGQAVPEAFWGVPDRSGPAAGARGLSVTQQQIFLTWLGFYYGEIDGTAGQETADAIKRFQVSIAAEPTGRLTGDQAGILEARGERAERNAGFETIEEEWTGIRIALPMGYLEPGEVPDNMQDEIVRVVYYPLGSTDLSVRLDRYENIRTSPQGLLDFFSKEHEEDEILWRNASGSFIDFAYAADGRLTNLVLAVGNNEVRGVTISFPVDRVNLFAPIRARMLSTLETFAGPGLAPHQRAQRLASGDLPGRQAWPTWMRTMGGSGSGSVVSYQGHILTNHHVVSGCERLTVNGNPAALLGIDIVNDLALLIADKFADRDPVRFRTRAARLGEEVVVMGYPLFRLLSVSLNSTAGIVSSSAGLGGDRRNIQITAPVQPGNSGGPVLDRDGHQIAVVVAKASARAQIEANAENIAWVIRGSVALDFLEEHGVRPLLVEDLPEASSPLADVIARARAYTVRVECHKR